MTGLQVGFTGTREGLTKAQLRAVEDLLVRRPYRRLHHGVCVGADAQVHAAAVALGIWPVGHPPVDERYLAQGLVFMPGAVSTPKSYLERDRRIVDVTVELIAGPKQGAEPKSKRGSGTWYTVGYARSLGRRIFIAWPNGTVTEEWPK